MKFKHVILGIITSMLLISCSNESSSNSNSTNGTSNTSQSSNDGDSTTSSHTHTFASGWESDETYHWHKSTCGHDVVSGKEEHTFKDEVTNPTYDAGGYTTHTCTVCDYSYVDSETAKLTHNYSSTWSHDEVNHWHACTDKGYESLKGDEAKHTFKDEVVAPTFDKGGYTTHTCTVCGYSYSDSQTSKLDHNYSSNWSHDNSSHWHACTDNGYENLKKDEATHNYKITTIKPTYDADGYTLHSCEVCDYSYKDNETAKLTHNYASTWSSDKNSHWHACTDKGYENLKKDEAKHTFEDEVTKPTYNAEGYTTHTCTVCDYSYKDNETAKLTHNYESAWSNDEVNHWHACTDKGYESLKADEDEHTYNDVVTPATYEADGYTTHKCTVCGYSYKDSYKDKLEHSYSEYWSTSVTSHWHACTDEGYESLYSKKANHSFGGDGICTVCGYSEGYTSNNLQFKLNADRESYSVIGMGSETATNISIPSTYNGKPVTSIADGAFYNCDIVSLSIPDSVTEIEGYAINYCEKLTNITLSNNLTIYGSYAISSCDSLEYNEFEGVKYLGSFTNPYLVLIKSISKDITSVNINENCKFIDAYAFSTCDNLTDISIPASVTSISSTAFKECIKNLESLTVDSNNEVYDSRNNCNALIETANNKLILGCKSTIIPDGITTIGQYAFKGCTGLTELKFPDSVTTINVGAFGDCTGLTGQLVISENVTSLGKEAFYGCGFTSIKLLCSLNKLPDYVFADCRNLKEITIAGKIEKIENQAFSYNTTNVESIYFNGDINGWLSTNTDNLPNFTDLYLLDDNGAVEHDDQKYSHVEGNLIIPNDSSLTIGSRSFSGLKDITSVTIPANVTNIADGAFSYCTNLSSIIVDEGNERFDSRNNCNAIISKKTNTLIQGCKSTVIPEGVTSIWRYAFCGLGITSIVIPEGVTSIGENAFSECTSLTDITLPEGLTTIEYAAFAYCSSLTSIIIPKSLTSIGTYAFAGCKFQAVYFAGTYEEMESKNIYPDTFSIGRSKAYYYSESEPTSDDGYKHWHYVDGKPTTWETE